MQICIDQKFVMCWLRRDLRLQDNAALYHALKSGYAVLPIFIYDSDILDKLPKQDKRVVFIHRTITDLQTQLADLSSSLYVFHGTPTEFFGHHTPDNLQAVYTNQDYEPYARERDSKIMQILSAKNIGLNTYKDHVIFEKNEVLSGALTPYTVFTPYSKTWKKKLTPFYIRPYPTEKYFSALIQLAPFENIPLETMGFEDMPDLYFPDKNILADTVAKYAQNRDYPALKQGTSRLSIHLRFGTVSIRKLAKYALDNSEIWLNELIWRDFYQAIIWHFPHAAKGAFRPAYERIEWRNNIEDFQAWCEGRTGYPLVDAGMRELLQTGFMHNRVRMVVASFLVKHLLIDWRWGEAFFAEKLLDFDLASNNGGWQWAAGSGCDAAPYFRVFNPTSQTEKFDKNLEYIQKWIPEYKTSAYPAPIVEHTFARNRVLQVYKQALQP